MRKNETEREMVERHIEKGAELIATQQALVARLKQGGLPTQEAELLLITFGASQCLHEDHLARLRK